MQHTFKLVDRLMALLTEGPHRLNTEADKEKARKVLKDIIRYADSLQKLIEAHKNFEYLQRLNNTHVQEVKGWTTQVQQTLIKLDSLVKMLRSDAEKMRKVIETEPQKWAGICSDMALGMVLTGLHDEEEDMKRLRKIALFEIHELKQIIEDEEHIAELLE